MSLPSNTEELMHARAAALSYEDARRYVESRGWARVPTRRTEVGVFRLRDHEAHLPMDTSLRDYASAMVLFARAVAEAEGRSVERVIADLAAARSDRHRPARVGPADASGASLEAASAMLDGVSRSLLSAACSAVQPRAFHPRMSLGDAQAFLAQTRFSHTETGSFVMVVDTPTEVEGTREGFGRAASELLMRSLSHLATSIRAGTPHRVTEPQAGEPQVSANLCEALLWMAPPNEAADLRFEVAWSPLLPAPKELASVVTIDRHMYEAVESLAAAMRPSTTSAHPWHAGWVKELRGNLGDSGHMEGEVVFALLEDETRSVRAKAYLDPDLYQRALEAHAKAELVTVIGELHRVRRDFVLRNVTDIEET